MEEEYLSDLSYDVHSLIHNIIGYAELLRMPGLDDHVRNEYVDIIFDSGNELLKKTSGLMNDLGCRDLAGEVKASGPEPEMIAGVELQGRKILIAEDEKINFVFLREVLRRAGASVIYAMDGVEAVEAVRFNTDLDLVVMDIIMPQMDGLQAVYEIKKIRPNLPVIAVSARSMQGDEEEALEAGFDYFVTKPLSLDILRALIRKSV